MAQFVAVAFSEGITDDQDNMPQILRLPLEAGDPAEAMAKASSLLGEDSQVLGLLVNGSLGWQVVNHLGQPRPQHLFTTCRFSQDIGDHP